MCRLFGVIANKPVDIEFSFFKADTPFEKFSESNPHGWGIAWYENSTPRVFKEGWKGGKYSFNRVREVKSRIIISHVRYATHGEKTDVNAHPFIYDRFAFAHNGSVNRKKIISHLDESLVNAIQGETDSEAFFMLIVQSFRSEKDIIEAIRNSVDIVRRYEYSSLNFLLSDGTSLYAFRDARRNESYYSLYYLERDPNKYQPFEYMSEETKQLLRSKSLLGEKAVIFSSEPLTKGESWREIEIGELIVVDEDLNVKKVQI